MLANGWGTILADVLFMMVIKIDEVNPLKMVDVDGTETYKAY